MSEIIDLDDWLKAQTDTFDFKKKFFGTTITHKATGEKVIYGFRYYFEPIETVVAAFESGDINALTSLQYALDEDDDPDTSAVCLIVAYTKSGAFFAAQPQEYQNYVPTLIREPKFITATVDQIKELDQTK